MRGGGKSSTDVEALSDLFSGGRWRATLLCLFKDNVGPLLNCVSDVQASVDRGVAQHL